MPPVKLWKSFFTATYAFYDDDEQQQKKKTKKKEQTNSKDLPCTWSRWCGQCPATSHWARSDILNLMEIDERLLWYEIASPATLCPCCPPGKERKQGGFFQSGSVTFLVFLLLSYARVCVLDFFIIKVISADGRTKFIDSISSPALALAPE